MTVKDYEDLIARMKAVPRLLDQTKAILDQAVAKGITAPKIVLRYLPKQIESQTPGDHVPDFHFSSTILTFWNGTFEPKIAQRMIFNLNREPLDP